MFGIKKIKERLHKVESLLQELCPHEEFDFYYEWGASYLYKKKCVKCGRIFFLTKEQWFQENREQDERRLIDKLKWHGYDVVSKSTKGKTIDTGKIKEVDNG